MGLTVGNVLLPNNLIFLIKTVIIPCSGNCELVSSMLPLGVNTLLDKRKPIHFS